MANYEPKIKNRGFTLIEMLVSMAVFMMVMVIALSSFLEVHDALAKAESLRTANDNFSFVLEAMMRDIRTGSEYKGFVGQPDRIEFTNPQDDKITYQLKNGRVQRKCQGGVCGDQGFIELTAPDVVVTKLEFTISGNAPAGDGLQPMVTIVISGYMGDKTKTRSYFDLQTTISQRTLEK